MNRTNDMAPEARRARRGRLCVAYFGAAALIVSAGCSGHLTSKGEVIQVQGNSQPTARISGSERTVSGAGETYTLHNRSRTSSFSWEIASSADWLRFSPSTGRLDSGESVDVEVAVETTTLDIATEGTFEAHFVVRDAERDAVFGSYTYLVVVDPDQGPELVTLDASAVELEIELGAALDVDPITTVLRNDGAEELAWRVWVTQPWLTIPATWQGALAPGTFTSVEVEFDSVQINQLSEGAHVAQVAFQATTRDGRRVPEEPLTRDVLVTVSSANAGRDPIATRNQLGAVAIFDFEEPGARVLDKASAQPPLDLDIENPNSVTWMSGHLRLGQPSRLFTQGPASKIRQACQASNELTIEAWITPANTTQDGPARIVSISAGANHRSATLGQGMWSGQPATVYNTRLRTTATDLNGMPLVVTPAGVAQTALQHVVYTRGTNNQARIYVNGVQSSAATIGGTLANWDSTYRLALGNEFGVERPWLGDLHLVAIYPRALTGGQVAGLTAMGSGDRGVGALQVTPELPVTTQAVLGGMPAQEQFDYQVRNTGTETIAWQASSSQPWAQVDPAFGSLLSGENAICQVTLNGSVTSLSAGLHTATVTFENTTNGLGDVDREVQLTVTDPGNPPPPPTGNHPILQPGSGWAGATTQPGQIGSGFASDRKTIARWDVVQALDVSAPTEIGLLAFHTNGIERIDIAVNGGPWARIDEIEMNPRVNVAEYWAVIDPQLFTANTVAEVRAIAYPNQGVPRVLESLYVNVLRTPGAAHTAYVSPVGSDHSGNGSAAAPFQTINRAAGHLQSLGGGRADGGTILLAAGDYSIANTPVITQSRYLTITTAPGAARANTRLTGHVGLGLNTRRLRLKNLTIRTYMDTTLNAGNYLWLDGCHQLGNGQHALAGPGSSSPWLPANFPWNWMGMTDCEVSDARFGPTMSIFQRGTRISRIGEDVFRYPKVLVNVTIDRVHPGNTGWHSDLIEISGGFTNENMLLYNVEATNVNAQGIFLRAPAGQTTTLRDSALVNFLLHKTDNVWISQFHTNSSVSNVLFWNCTIANMSLGILSPGVTSLDVRNSVMHNIFQGEGGQVQSSWFNDCHFILSAPLGAGATSGNVPNLFQNVGALDFSPGVGSPLLNRTSNQVPYDLNGFLRAVPAAVGALED
jgi:hypothetical protein